MNLIKLSSLLLPRLIVPALLLFAAATIQAAPTFWTGPTNTFIHAANSSTMDKLTTNHVGGDAVNNVWLTRGTRAPLYNAAAESSSGSLSPLNTKWVVASGPLTSAASLTYGTFDSVVGQAGGPSPGLSVGKTFYVHIVSDDIYLMLKLTEWGMSDGGSFQYQRSFPPVVPPTPTVTITNPVTGSTFIGPTNVSIGASASVSSGSVTNVQFFTNGASLKSVTASPFTITATNLNVGSYALTAVATAAGISATSVVVNITVLGTPAVTITNPTPGATFTAPATVNIGASASVSGGTVTNVQFFTNGVSLKSVTASPFTLTLTNLNAGVYALTAVATASGISATSAIVNISVLSTPTVSITNPPPGAIFAAPANVNLGASAAVSGGTVTNVQFFTNNVALGSVTTAPFTLTATGLAAGAYALTAVATASGISATSVVVNISVISPPSVSITNPADGAVFAAPATVNLAASASAGVTNVQFFTNNVSVGSVATAPFSRTASNLPAGSYALTAVATASGIFATSTVVNISVVSSSLTVSLTNPAPGAVFAAPASLKLGATASAGVGTVTNVQFFASSNSLGSVTAPPFNLTTSPLAAGAYSLSAIATAGGITATSAIVNVSVINPTNVNLSGITIAGGHFNFSYTADAGLTYIVQSSSNLFNWVTLATNTASASPAPFSDTFNPNGATYYRVGRLPNP